MKRSRFTVAKLDKERLEKVCKLEEEFGVYLVALEQEFELAELPEEKLKELQKAEEELGVVLLAYKSEQAE